MRKRLFIQRLLMKRDAWEALVNRAGFAHLTAMPGICGVWSVKEVLAQLTLHEQYLADRLDEIAHGEAYTPAHTLAQLEAFQARFGYLDLGSRLLSSEYIQFWAVEKYRSVPIDEVVEQEIAAFCEIINSLEALEPDTLLRHKLYEQVVRHTSELYHTHSNAIAQRLVKVNP